MTRKSVQGQGFAQQVNPARARGDLEKLESKKRNEVYRLTERMSDRLHEPASTPLAKINPPPPPPPPKGGRRIKKRNRRVTSKKTKSRRTKSRRTKSRRTKSTKK